MTEHLNYDFSGRIAHARQRMIERNLDALYVNAGPNMRYFAGWSAYSGGWPVWLSVLLIPREGEPAFLLTDMHRDILKYSDSWIKDGEVVTYMDGEDPSRKLRGLLEEKGLRGGRLGVEDTMWYGDFDLLTEVDPAVKVERAGDLFDRLRQVKDAAEIEAIRRANAITVAGYERAAEVIREGVQESVAAMEIVKAMLEAGSGTMGIGGHLRNLLPRTLQRGDVIDVDMGASWDGYHTDTARNFFVGQATKDEERAYEVTRDCFYRTVEMVKPGIEAQEVHHFAAGYMKKHGYEQVWKIGHGVGLNQGHEAPLLQAGETVRLEPGMVFVIDPGCFISGHFRDTPIHIEDCVVVTATGCENLTTYTRDLQVV